MRGGIEKGGIEARKKMSKKGKGKDRKAYKSENLQFSTCTPTIFNKKPYFIAMQNVLSILLPLLRV